MIIDSEILSASARIKLMDDELKAALAVKAKALEVIRAYVFGEDNGEPRVKPDQTGVFHYRDKKLHITCDPSGRDGWSNCAIMVFILRKQWFLFRKRELVLSTGLGVDLWAYRPGMWVDYVTRLAETAEKARHQRSLQAETDRDAAELRDQESRVSPVDDSSVFKD